MKQTRWFSLALLCAVAQAGLHASETVTDSANAAFVAVEEAGSARAVGMGSTYVGIAEGSASLPWNPAGLAGLCAAELALHHDGTVLGSYQETVVLGLPMGAGNGFGASIQYGDNGSYEGRDAAGNATSDYSASSLGASLGWGMHLATELSLGAAVKLNRQDLAGESFNAAALDLGALWSPNGDLTLGAAYTGLGVGVAGSDLAQGVNLGASTYLWKGGNFQWLLSFSGEALTHSDSSLHAGLEATFYQMLSLRGGFGHNLTHPATAETAPGWTLGIGAKIAELSVDYAFVPMSDIGNLQRISLTYAFGACTPSSSKRVSSR